MMCERGKLRVLVIGYGSLLRGDDQAGRIVADALVSEAIEGVRVISATQLVPEIAVDVAEAHSVIFIDARVEEDFQGVWLQEINAAGRDARQSHVMGPSQLLQLSKRCFGWAPQAWLITVPGQRFELSTDVSSEMHRHGRTAVAVAKRLIRTLLESEVTYA
jgi:hydrogenase maturation protease